MPAGRNFNYNQYNQSNQLNPDKTNSLSSWDLLSGDINQITKQTYKKISDCCATAYHQQSLISGAINVLVDNVIGKGLRFQSIPDNRILKINDKKLREWTDQVEARFQMWADSQKFNQIQSTIYNASKVRGDCLLFLQYNNFKKQLVLRDSESTIINTNYTNDNDIVNGIIKNKQGLHSGILLNDKREIKRFGANSKRLNYLLFFTSAFPNQMRGLPLAYKVIEVAKNFDRYFDAEISAAVMNACLIGYWKTDKLGNATIGQAPRTADKTKSEQETRDLQPNQFLKIATDEHLEIVDSKRPSQNINDVIIVAAKIVAIATGIPVEMVLKNYNASFSASRAARLDGQVTFDKEQSHFVDLVCKPVYKEWLINEVRENRIQLPFENLDSYSWQAITNSQWIGTPLKSLNPQQEAKADIELMNAGLVTRESLVLKYGGTDFASHTNKLKKEKELMGISETPEIEQNTEVKENEQLDK